MKFRIANAIPIIFVVILFTSYKFYLIDWEQSRKLVSLKVQNTLFYNEPNLHENYPICSELDNYQEIVWIEEKHKRVEDAKYDRLIGDNKFLCGKTKTSGYFSSGKSTNWRGCGPAVVPAKRRLFNFMKDLCSAQDIAQKLCKKLAGNLTAEIQDSHDTTLNRTSQYESVEENLEKLKWQHNCYVPLGSVGEDSSTEGTVKSHAHLRSNVTTHEDDTVNINRFAERKPRRGIIYTGRATHFKHIYQSILAYHLRISSDSIAAASNDVYRSVEGLARRLRPQSDLSIEIWVNRNSLSLCQTLFEADFKGVKCIAFANGIMSFVSKFYALLYTTLDEVLFLDADNVMVRNANEIFDSHEFKRTGAILWPDLCGYNCTTAANQQHGAEEVAMTVPDAVYPEFALWKAQFLNLRWEDSLHKAQETVASQVALDLRRHKGLVNLGRKLLEDMGFFNKIFQNSDKDIFRFMFLLARIPFSVVALPPGYSIDDNGQQDHLLHYHHNPDYPGSSSHIPMFYHQFKTRNPSSFLKFVRLPPSSAAASVRGDRILSETSNGTTAAAVSSAITATAVATATAGTRAALHSRSFCVRVLLHFQHQMETLKPLTMLRQFAHGTPRNISTAAAAAPTATVGNLSVHKHSSSHYSISPAAAGVSFQFHNVHIQINKPLLVTSTETGAVYSMEVYQESLQLYEFGKLLYHAVDHRFDDMSLQFWLTVYVMRDNYVTYTGATCVVILIVFVIRLIVWKGSSSPAQQSHIKFGN